MLHYPTKNELIELQHYWTEREKREVDYLLREAETKQIWPRAYLNRETNKFYKPHHQDEYDFVTTDTPRYGLVKGGEGGGKSVCGIVKDLERLRRGCNGILTSPDLPHFKKSLWKEFRRWCPIEAVIESQRYRLNVEWQPSEAFEMVFYNDVGGYSTLLCGGIENPTSWEGPNVNFFHLDEARKISTPQALKVLDGRIRIPGPHGEPPQGWITTTPEMNWLFDYYGQVECTCKSCGEDFRGKPHKDEYGGHSGGIPGGEFNYVCPKCGNISLTTNDEWVKFKQDSLVITLLTIDNENSGNLESGYTDNRSQTLTESESNVLLRAEWESISDSAHFLPSMTLWDACRTEFPPLDKHTPIVIALDAAKGRLHSPSDCFGLLAASRHPANHANVALRFSQKWQARSGQKIDYDGTEENPGPGKMLERLAKMYNIVQVCYDPTELHYFAMTYAPKLGLWFEEIPQAMGTQKRPGRGIYDGQFLDLITQRRIAHDGDKDLREHISNANKKTDPEDRKVRLVKRNDSQKIDLAVCASMASGECLRLAI